MENFIVVLILALIVAGAVWYIYKAKKRGEACIGCPYAKECANKCKCQSENK